LTAAESPNNPLEQWRRVQEIRPLHESTDCACSFPPASERPFLRAHDGRKAWDGREVSCAKCAPQRL